MSFQVDGKVSLAQQEMQLQALETFFVEVIDYNAGADVKNDVTVKNIADPVASPIHLKAIQTPADLAQIATGGATIVFDRQVFADSQRQRVAGYRAAAA